MAMSSCLAGPMMLVLAIVTSGCLEPPELVEVSLPEEAIPGETFSVRWAIADRDQSDAEHSEIHWSVDDASLDMNVTAKRTGDGRFHEPSCGPDENCPPGPHFVAHLTAPEHANTMYYQIHTEGDGWQVDSKVIEVRIAE